MGMPDWFVMAGLENDVERLRTELAAAQAELAALRPWAEMGKETINGVMYCSHDPDGTMECYFCGGDGYHAIGCPIPALLKQLESTDAS